MQFKNLRKILEQSKLGLMSTSTPSQVPDKYALDPGEKLLSRINPTKDLEKKVTTQKITDPAPMKFPDYEDLLRKQIKKDNGN